MSVLWLGVLRFRDVQVNRRSADPSMSSAAAKEDEAAGRLDDIEAQVGATAMSDAACVHQCLQEPHSNVHGQFKKSQYSHLSSATGRQPCGAVWFSPSPTALSAARLALARFLPLPCKCMRTRSFNTR